ncbi:hypothetical protein [Aquabacter sediminis]|uniref:hypothetical protein n=1 Tax=Aquabacter sediminis TaxID=3029197 RepID=UPI00237DDF80|nr:hypothetical protein [Aquabacter sp. P-9]MDE1567941.1 hypothetical protein [Aquabacter sp. P-9]
MPHEPGAPAPSQGAALDAVTARLARLPALLEANAPLMERGRFLTVDCLLGTPARPFHTRIVEGRITAMESGPRLMASWRFAYRASPEAFLEFWKPLPRAGSHDLLALTKSGAASLEGDLHPFIANLQYFKDLLALPRSAAQPSKEPA